MGGKYFYMSGRRTADEGNEQTHFHCTHKRTACKNRIGLLPVFEGSINYGGWGINYPIQDQGPRDSRLMTAQSESLKAQGDSCRLIEIQRHI